MSVLAAPPDRPPSPPLTATTVSEDDGARRYRLRRTQVLATLVTLLVTAWVCTLGWIPAIIGLSVAKHILVAVLAMGLGVDAPQEKK